MVRDVEIGDEAVNKVVVGEKQPLTLIGGPCAIESEEHSLIMAKEIKEIADEVGIQYVFKSSYDKDSRSSIKSYLGIGEQGLDILKKVKSEVQVPVTSDVSNETLMENTVKAVDMIQIPAYLCRQTHLLVAAGRTGKPVNIKKGQFLSPWNTKNAALKVASTGNHNIILTDRGTFFGYNYLVSDMRCIKIMKETGYPVCYDATHSIQMPGSLGTHSGGQREFIPTLVRSAIAAGANAVFMEIHDNPDKALCDATTQLPLRYLRDILFQAKRIYELRQGFHTMGIEEREDK